MQSMNSGTRQSLQTTPFSIILCFTSTATMTCAHGNLFSNSCVKAGVLPHRQSHATLLSLSSAILGTSSISLSENSYSRTSVSCGRLALTSASKSARNCSWQYPGTTVARFATLETTLATPLLYSFSLFGFRKRWRAPRSTSISIVPWWSAQRRPPLILSL